MVRQFYARIDQIDLRSPVDEKRDAEIEALILRGSKYSVRTRLDSHEGVSLVVKCSLNDESSANGPVRKELTIPVSVKLDVLDGLLLNYGMSYLSKWSRSRYDYPAIETTDDGYKIEVTADWNSGYGGIIEAEIQLEDLAPQKEVDAALASLNQWMQKYNLELFDSKDIDRLFGIYNKNWERFYTQDLTIWEVPELLN
ncbi:MAG: hypothetical protein WBB28_01260 [Crinalium sp.]